jgi:hypothetical protein
MDLLMKFIVVGKLAEDRGIEKARARKLGLIAGMIPGTMGLMLGIIMARRETPPPPPSNEDASANRGSGRNLISDPGPRPGGGGTSSGNEPDAPKPRQR